MKRLILMIVSASLILSSGAFAFQAVDGARKHACCATSDCTQALQQMSCCKDQRQGTIPKAIPSIQPIQKFGMPIDATSPFSVKLACDKHPPKDKSEAPPEQETLYLLHSVFLI